MTRVLAIIGAILLAGVVAFTAFRRGFHAAAEPSASPADSSSPTNVQRASANDDGLLRGAAALGDATTDRPGVRRLITAADMPRAYATTSADNRADIIARPASAWPQAPAGFAVQQFATGLANPRKIIFAPNGDLFVAESHAGRILVFRGAGGTGAPMQKEIFASELDRVFGMAFYPSGKDPQFLYVANTGSVVRFPYRNGDLQARGKPEAIVPDIPGGGLLHGGGHWTRDIVFSLDGSKMYVSVGSLSNVDDDFTEKRRADILEFTPDGKNERIFASGIRNAVGLAVHPATGDIWASVNERDDLGDDLPPDYITRVAAGGFYGWPWFYIGANQDPRHKGAHPELRDKVLTPDVLLQAHSASLCITFYDGAQFPAEYRGNAFAAEHGSWNRAKRTGYKVIRVPAPDGKPTGEYDDFLTGFVTAGGKVWGRPVGVAVAPDGSLLVSDDGSHSIWRVSYTGGAKSSGSSAKQ